eukprot:364682-Chlamydomonas_euryale.AAC.8
MGLAGRAVARSGGVARVAGPRQRGNGTTRQCARLLAVSLACLPRDATLVPQAAWLRLTLARSAPGVFSPPRDRHPRHPRRLGRGGAGSGTIATAGRARRRARCTCCRWLPHM